MKARTFAPLVLALIGCHPGPDPIRWGSDTCDRCRMILVDRRFGAELVTNRTYKFDGVDELARFLAARHPPRGEIYVTDGDSGRLIPADQAVFMQSSRFKGPMGGHVMSFGSRAKGERYAAQHGLRDVRWLSLRQSIGTVGGTVLAKR